MGISEGAGPGMPRLSHVTDLLLRGRLCSTPADQLVAGRHGIAQVGPALERDISLLTARRWFVANTLVSVYRLQGDPDQQRIVTGAHLSLLGNQYLSWHSIPDLLEQVTASSSLQLPYTGPGSDGISGQLAFWVAAPDGLRMLRIKYQTNAVPRFAMGFVPRNEEEFLWNTGTHFVTSQR